MLQGIVKPDDSGVNENPSNRKNYAPHFEEPTSVYRRVGEDTNGDGTVDVNDDGVVSNNDTNYDVCPIVIGAGPLGPRPTWRPDYGIQRNPFACFLYALSLSITRQNSLFRYKYNSAVSAKSSISLVSPSGPSFALLKAET